MNNIRFMVYVDYQVFNQLARRPGAAGLLPMLYIINSLRFLL